MVYKKNELKALIEDFVKKAKKKILIERIILFGSYAYGRPNRYSDIDLAVISSSFKKIDEVKRIAILLGVARKVKMPRLVDIELLGFTPQELEKAGYFDVAGEIRQHGKIIYTADSKEIC